MSSKIKVVILGGGVTGLSSSYFLSKDSRFDVTVVERQNKTGGLCRSFTEDEFILDHGPHKFYSLIPGTMESMRSLMGESLLERDKKQSLYLRGRYYNFPLKMTEMLTQFSPLLSSEILLSFSRQLLKNALHSKHAHTYESFLTQKFGAMLYGLIFEPMAKKIYGDPKKLDQKLAEIRISSPSLFSVVKQALFPKTVTKEISAPKFYYPKLGYGKIPERLTELSEKQGVQFLLDSTVKALNTSQGKFSSVVVESNNKTQTLECDYLIYTLPIQLVSDLAPHLDAKYKMASRFIHFRHSVIYYFLLKSKPLLPSMWVFFPEPQYRFGRLSEMIHFSPSTCPKDTTALMVDFTCDDLDPFWHMDDKDLGDCLYEQLKWLFDKKLIIKSFSKRFKHFYPVYYQGYEKNLNTLRELESEYKNIFFLGRLGDFNYNNSDQCFDMGHMVSEYIQKQGHLDKSWSEIRTSRFDQYKIVD